MHIPVLQKEVLKCLDPKPNENFIDCTIGGGGHTKGILEKTKPKGKVLGIDSDNQQIENSKNYLSGFKKRLILVNDSYINLKTIVRKNNFYPVKGILLDLGMSGWHLENSGRGFSFLRNESLDMRYDNKACLTAREIINKWDQQEIERVLKEYGEERFSREIAKAIIQARKETIIQTTSQLVGVIKKAIPPRYQHQPIHYATKTFQALRIAVNDELNNLKKILPQTIEILENQGRLVIISFHSLEDRLVKNFLREEAKKKTIQILTKKPIIASFQELKINPRSRSAKLRAAVKKIKNFSPAGGTCSKLFL